ncbi:unnamed protein product [Tuwongella immobilis]|uniref:Uncharacterized protein n=1 Tax=Tuwongella immobilis TaxID=692036 RepID=A0A6C2YNU7_9BACT|nr:unnamed protein product [Tuwongella immobilis]VTS03279.1 unnamed protein product [Tuwongella immobilis]
MKWLTYTKQIRHEFGWTPHMTLHEHTVHQLFALQAPVGSLSPAEAFVLLNERRARRGLPPLDGIP